MVVSSFEVSSVHRGGWAVVLGDRAVVGEAEEVCSFGTRAPSDQAAPESDFVG